MRLIPSAPLSLISTAPVLARTRPQTGPFPLNGFNMGADLDGGRPVAPAGRPSAPLN